MSQELEKLQRRPKGYVRTEREKEIEALECLRLKVIGLRDVDIAERMNLTRQTVAKRIRFAVETQGKKTVETYREIISQRYEVAFERLAPQVDAGNLDALGKWLDANAKYARLVGAEAPVQVDVEVTQVTEQEKQLRDMLAQAERDAKVQESDIIRGEVVDA